MELIEQPLKINAEIVSKTNFFMTVLAQVDIHTLLAEASILERNLMQTKLASIKINRC